jgi:hypothetical protein
MKHTDWLIDIHPKNQVQENVEGNVIANSMTKVPFYVTSGSFSIYRLNSENNFGENLILIIKFSLKHLNEASNHTSYGR